MEVHSHVQDDLIRQMEKMTEIQYKYPVYEKHKSRKAQKSKLTLNTVRETVKLNTPSSNSPVKCLCTPKPSQQV